MTGTRWFSYVVMGASFPSEPVVLEAIERVLDVARPADIDPERSEAIDGSFVIAHSLGHLGDIEIEVWDDWADLKSVVIDRQIRADDLGPEWIKETARTVDHVIRGHYDIEQIRWRNKIIRTDVSSQDRTTRRITSAWDRLPIPDRFLTHKRTHLDYGCDSQGGATSNRQPGAKES